MGLLISIIVTGLSFLAITKLLPGFTMKKPETAFIAAAIYLVMCFVIAIPLAIVVVPIFVFLAALLPFLGFLAKGAMWIAALILSFVVGVAALRVTDHFLEDFEMDNLATACIAAAMLSVISTGVRLVLSILF
ncbi:MAG: phage holin family protein [Candidatus Riflebacteria bacterium]|nr:phage holin family protein [Candidatus Riflebacteria bacterium]